MPLQPILHQLKSKQEFLNYRGTLASQNAFERYPFHLNFLMDEEGNTYFIGDIIKLSDLDCEASKAKFCGSVHETRKSLSVREVRDILREKRDVTFIYDEKLASIFFNIQQKGIPMPRGLNRSQPVVDPQKNTRRFRNFFKTVGIFLLKAAIVGVVGLWLFRLWDPMSHLADLFQMPGWPSHVTPAPGFFEFASALFTVFQPYSTILLCAIGVCFIGYCITSCLLNDETVRERPEEHEPLLESERSENPAVQRAQKKLAAWFELHGSEEVQVPPAPGQPQYNVEQACASLWSMPVLLPSHLPSAPEFNGSGFQPG